MYIIIKMRMKKKGLSPVIATVLLISLVVVLALLVFLWARAFLGEQIEKFHGGENKPIERVCENVDFSVELVYVSEIVTSIEIVNRGNIPINSFDVKLEKGGNSIIENFPFKVGVGGSYSGPFSLATLEIENPEKLIFYPSLVGKIRDKNKNQPHSCIDNGFEVNL